MSSPSPFRRLLALALAERTLLVKTVILLVFATGADVMGPILIKVFIDDHVIPGNWSTGPLLLLLLGYLGANVIAAALSYLQSIKLTEIAQHVVLKLRQRLFDHVIRLPLRDFHHTPTGSVISRVTNDTESIQEMFTGVLGVYLQNSIRVLGIFIAMAWLNWQLMLICLLFVPLVIAVMALYRRLSTPVFQRGRALLSDINSQLNESVQGMPVIQLFNQQRAFRRRFEDLTTNHFKVRRRTMRLDALLLRPMVDMLYMLTLAGLLFYFGISTVEQSIEIGVLYAFVNYLGRFTEPLIEMTQRLNLFQQANVATARVFEWLDRPAEPDSSEPAALADHPTVAIDGVNFSYLPDEPVLRDVSLKIPFGRFVGIVGHTGSGKSTLASLLMGFYAPDQGEIHIGGHNLRAISRRKLREQIAIVQQDSFIYRGTVQENIDVGRGLTIGQIRSAVERCGLTHLIDELPHGLQTMLEERGSNLSAGQRQLLSLIRAMAGAPEILILDEATANVDSETEARVQQALMSVRGDLTLIVIAHRLSTITGADEIIALHKGEIIQRGTHQTLMSEEGFYQHLFQLQLRQPESAGESVKTDPIPPFQRL